MRKLFLSILSIIIISSFCVATGFQNVNAANNEVSKPQSNVDSKTKQNIIKKIKKSNAYKKHANSTSIDSIKDDDIIVHLDKGKNTNHMMYSKFVKYNNKEYINMKGILNGKPYYEFNIDQKGHYYDKNFKHTSKDEIEKDSAKNLPPKERGWCEWAVGALCGTGGAAGCWATATALGITTGWGGFSLATICGLISSLGCTGATNYICK